MVPEDTNFPRPTTHGLNIEKSAHSIRVLVAAFLLAASLVGCSTRPPCGPHINEPGVCGSSGFSVRFPAKLVSAANFEWKPEEARTGPTVIIPPHWKCRLLVKFRSKARFGVIWVESDAVRQNPKYAHGEDGPFTNAGHILEALERRLEFPWGEATSLVTISSNSLTNLRAHNEDMTYIVKGRSRDGRWWVTGMFPISHRSLPRDEKDPRAVAKHSGDLDRDAGCDRWVM